MEKIKSPFAFINPVDFIVILFLLYLSLLNLLFHQRVESWYLNLLVNLFISVYIIFTAFKYKSTGKKLWFHLRYWYLVPLVFIIFKELYTMIDPIRGIIYDDVLIEIDRVIFGTDPTVFLYGIANPFLTELLQIVYGTFFFLPVILGLDLILTSKWRQFEFGAFIIVYGFLLSFIGYIIVPAIGPRFTLHDFERNNIEMPGLLVTDFLREIVNTGESIPTGTPEPAKVVQRDAFPSGHTLVTLLVMYLSVKFKSRLKIFFLINGTLLIFATVYLRYHYVIDLIGGLIFMLFALASGRVLYNSLCRMAGKEEFNYQDY